MTTTLSPDTMAVLRAIVTGHRIVKNACTAYELATMTDAEIIDWSRKIGQPGHVPLTVKAELKAANAAVDAIRVYAVSMIYAQSAEITAEQRAILARQADALRAVLETDEPQEVAIKVFYARNHAEHIGYLRFTL